MGNFLRHERCPKHGGTSLARYSDGGAYCFGCGYRERSKGRPPDHRNQVDTFSIESIEAVAALPDDVSTEYTSEMLDWVGRYGLSAQELIKRNVVCSPQRRQLIFKWFDENKRLVVWQSRNFWEKAKSKATTHGDLNGNCLFYRASCSSNILDSDNKLRSLVIVEDPVSAIKIARQSDCMPLLGSTISVGKLNVIAGLYSRAIVWLDEDKLSNAMEIARNLQLLGLNARVVHTQQDPKEYGDDEIQQRLDK